MGVASDASEGAFGFEHPRGDPPFLHSAGLPVLDPAGRGAHDRDHRLDTVRVRQRPAQLDVDPEAGDAEHVVEAFTQARGGVGVRVVELVGEVATRPEAFDRIRLGERDRETPIDQVALIGGEIPGDVAALVQLMPISA